MYHLWQIRSYTEALLDCFVCRKFFICVNSLKRHKKATDRFIGSCYNGKIMFIRSQHKCNRQWKDKIAIDKWKTIVDKNEKDHTTKENHAVSYCIINSLKNFILAWISCKVFGHQCQWSYVQVFEGRITKSSTTENQPLIH